MNEPLKQAPFPVNIIGGILRTLPIVSGPGNLANGKCLRRFATAREAVWMKTRWDDSLLCFLDDYIGRSVAYFGDLDPKLSWILSTVLRPGDDFIDVGANVGLLTTLGAKLVGKEGRVLAIEPQPRILDYLRATLEKNALTQVIVAPVGVSDVDDTLQMHIPKNNLGGASFCHELSNISGTVEVVVRKFSELLFEHEFTHPRLVKMDVEGWEAEVIRGALPIWKETPPPAIIFEFREAPDTLVRETKAGRLLSELGYQFYRLPRKLFKPCLLSVESEAMRDVAVSHDVFAVHCSTSPIELGFQSEQVVS